MKKIIFTIASLLGITPLVSFATTSTIALPSGFMDNMWAAFNDAFAGLSPLTYTIMGVLLALVIMETVILMIRK